MATMAGRVSRRLWTARSSAAWRVVCLGIALLLAAGAARAAVEGRVVSARGTPIEHARVEIIDSEGFVYTDPEGRFRLAGAAPPLELRVTHPRFTTEVVAVEGDGPVEVRLDPKQQVFEEIAVSATRGEENFAPVSVAADVIRPAESAAPPATLTELVAEIPGVAENGQGGIFQTYSIRGVARLRVLTLISGMRITGERRAGVSASFLDPLLMGSVDVVRGPSSTYYGSGALGGVVQLFPRRFDGATVEAGWASQGDESYVVAGTGGEDWSAGVARRVADDAETPAGELLYSGFEQVSAVARRDWRSEGSGREYTVELVGSRGDDIHKANTDFPERATTYPSEEHLLVRFAVRDESGWSFDAWVHPNTLRTEVVELSFEEPGSPIESRAPIVSLNRLDNEALDLGFNWQTRRALGEGTQLRWGVDYYGRRGVEAFERDFDLTFGAPVPVASQRTLDGGEEDEAGVYGAFEWNVGKAVVWAGGRLAWQRQQNGGAGGGGPSRDDTAASGFAGVVVPLANGFELAANAGSGLRFPSLSERFFSGVTGRGEVTGNPGLDPERSLNVDLGLRWFGERLFVAGYLFRNEIDDYIERIEFAPGELTFVNLTSGTLAGVEMQGGYQLSSQASLSFGGHLLDGEDAAGEPLADVPSDRFFAGLKAGRGRWSWEGRWEERRAKSDAGSGERAIPGASLVSAAVRFEVNDRLELRLSGRNLLDEEYFNAADRRLPLAVGRSVGVGVRWKRGAAEPSS